MLGLSVFNLHRLCYGFGMMGRIGGMIIMMILFVGLIIFGIYWLSKTSNQRNTGYSQLHQADRSLEILNERYAKGEISDEEYSKMKAELKKNGA